MDYKSINTIRLYNLIMDIFGFNTQGINYDKFRPRYPTSFIQKCLFLIKHKNRYLDIATGTGQLLFAFAPHFSYNKGMDISKSMIDNAISAREKFLIEHPNTKVDLEVDDVMNLPGEIKYDLITVGQALHFFPIEESLKKIKGILAEDGCFTTFGYVIKQITSINPKENDYFCDFYKKVKPLFTFNRDELHTFYQDQARYPFGKVFGRVEREVEEVPLPMNKLEYLSYLKTMSGYNLYLQQNKEDPLAELSKVCGDEVTCVLYYFKIACYHE